jgi:glyoxalase superfamily protein
MASGLTTVVIDALDGDKVASFWAAVLGWERSRDPEGDIVISDPNHTASITLLVLHVPEVKRVKNRLHIDLNPIGVDQAEELQRLLDLGANTVDIGQGEPTWVVLADQEGNEFCLLRDRIDNELSDDAG